MSMHTNLFPCMETNENEYIDYQLIGSATGVPFSYEHPITAPAVPSPIPSSSEDYFRPAMVEPEKIKLGQNSEKVTKELNHTSDQFVSNSKKRKMSVPRKIEINPERENSRSPNYFMNLFFDDHIINLLVEGTNWFIDNIPRNRKDKIASVTPNEMRCVLAVLYLSGYVNLPRVRMFWERAPDTSFPLVVDAIPRDRFETIFANLHSVNSPSTDKKDPLSRISTLVDSLRNKFMQFAPVEEVHSIDELDVPYYKQSTGLRQFTKTKTMKVWCGCTNSGYCVWFDHIEETQGETNSLKPHIAFNKIVSYATKMSNFKLSKACLIYDNILNDIRTINELKNIGIEAKPVPNRVSMSVCKSYDASTHSLDKFREQSKVHNSPMGGIDKLDQNINLYAITIIGKKWTFHFLLAYILDLTIQNAWQLYRDKNQNALDLLGFRRSIVTYYLTRYGKPILTKGISSRKQAIKKTNKNGEVIEVPIVKSHYYRCKDIRYDGIKHYVTPQTKQTRCFHCKMKTMTRCSKCDVGIHVKCFVEYHTRIDTELTPKKDEFSTTDISDTADLQA